MTPVPDPRPSITMDNNNFNLRNVETFFVESGERQRLIELLLQRLNESDWVNLVEKKCREYIANQFDNATLDDMVNKVKKDAREAVPDKVKLEIMDEVRAFVARILAEEERRCFGT
ncbi:hypothetical protein L596_030467 [Steinernema carpocapsae]|uniref:Transcription and mRNA export factor ENY2 n=1 Tax=Steinernema carpocapsae TaxID=34508 RepID=A0A4U5LPI0_STECR|nr:hypothetical protein L596_030467 [Steinernema carpocapsae]